MTLNLVARDYPGTRDFAVIDTGRADVAAIVATFNADFAGRAITPPDGADLVWSPTNAKASVLSVIDGAKHTLAVEDEEMDDPAVTAALAAAARRGVHVTITMTADSRMGPGLHRTSPGRRAHPALPGHRPAPCTSTPRPSSPTPGGPASGCWWDRRTSPWPASATTGNWASSSSNAHIVAAMSATLASDYARAAAYSPSAKPPAPPATK